MSVSLCSLISLLQRALGDSLGDSPSTLVEGAFQPLGSPAQKQSLALVFCVSFLR